jgi:hypothetical protein
MFITAMLGGNTGKSFSSGRAQCPYRVAEAAATNVSDHFLSVASSFMAAKAPCVWK